MFETTSSGILPAGAYDGLTSQYYDPYQQLQTQQLQNYYHSNVYCSGMTLGVPAPVMQEVKEPSECSEFAWLRKRVEDILWK